MNKPTRSATIFAFGVMLAWAAVAASQARAQQVHR